MYEVIASDRGTVTVAREDNYFHVGLSKLDTGCERDRPAMRRMQSINVKEWAGNPTAASDSCDAYDILHRDSSFIDRSQERLRNDSIAAT
jgi:hypothetical protein